MSDSSTVKIHLPIHWPNRHPFIGIGLTTLALVCLAYPTLVLNLSSAIPGQDLPLDFSIFHWNIWWFQHAIFHLGQDPFYTNFVFYPHTINLAYHTFAPLLDLIAIPFYALFGLTAAVNILLIGDLVFDSIVMFAFLRHRSLPIGLAYIGSWLFTFSSVATAQLSVSHPSYLAIGWLPLSLLACDLLFERRTIWRAVALSGVLYAALMTDLQFGLWIGLLMLPYAAYRWVRLDRSARRKIFLLSVVSLALLVGVMLIAPLPQLLAGRSASYPHVTNYDELGYIKLENLVGMPPRFIAAEDQVILGMLLPLLVIMAVLRGKRRSSRWLWLIGALAFLVLALGPTLHPFEIPLPYRVIHEMLQGQYRAPVRFMLPAMFMLIVFALSSLQSDYLRLPRSGRYGAVLIVILALAIENRWYEAFPISTVPDYRIYHTIGAEPDEYTILEVPVGANNSATEGFGSGAQLQYYAAEHHKRLINGLISRAPVGTTHDYRKWRLITALAEERSVPDLDTAQREFQQLSHDWDIRYAIIHRDMISPELANWAIGFFNTRSDWCLVDDEGPVLAYHRLDGGACATASLLDPPSGGTIQIGDGYDDRYLGLGWYLSENVGGPQARWTGSQPTNELRVHLPQQNYRITLHATAFISNEIVSISANGAHISDLSIGESGWGEYSFNLPADLIPADGLMTLTLMPSRSQSAFDQTNGQVDDQRPLAVAYDSIEFVPVP